jgi:succinate-acetate transporter protein
MGRIDSVQKGKNFGFVSCYQYGVFKLSYIALVMGS